MLAPDPEATRPATPIPDTAHCPPQQAHAHRPRVVVFTDTIADINGVARFLSALASRAPAQVRILSSTTLAAPRADNILIVPPFLRRPMPAYPALDLVVPHAAALSRAADEFVPHVVHVSTPGPIGFIGRRYALRRGLPLVGTYHTDFPAYIERLLDDVVLTRAAERVLRWFYSPFDLVLARSPASLPSLARAGIAPEQARCFSPGIDTAAFHPAFRDQSGAVWNSIPGARPHSIKVLYVGRVSVEKHLPMLSRVWPRIRAASVLQGIDAQLIVVGDGPYLQAMQRELAQSDACFAGFRHGASLAAMYASADLFVFPSTTDTLGQAVMEAQASGLPAIVTDSGGPSCIVRHGVTGIVCPPHSEGQWIESIVRMLTRPAERASMAAAARLHLAPMTIAASLDEFLSLHTDALQKHKPGRALARGPTRR